MRKFWIAREGWAVALATVATLVFVVSPFQFTATTAGAGNPNVIYNSIPKPLPGNVGSEGPEAYAFKELGDGIVFTPGAGGTFDHVSVVLSSWGCTSGHWYSSDCVTKPPAATFNQRITLNIYSISPGPPPSPGTTLVSETQSFDVPYRPSSDPAKCAGDAQRWYSDRDKTCYHGLAVPIDFDLSALHVPIPDKVIVGVAFNSTHYGYAPIGESAPCYISSGGCPYDSLNISTDSGGFAVPPANAVFVGSFLVQDSIFVNYTSSAQACAGNTVTGVFAIDAGCWTGFHPQIEVVATGRATPPSSPKKPLDP
jgi:hypothetical protein